MNVVGVVLAAGASRRLGQPKQLVSLHGETLVRRAVRITGDVVGRVGVVVGAHADDVWRALDGSNAERIENPAWSEGMASSLRVAVAWADGADALLLSVCDQPHLEAAHLAALVAMFERTGTAVGSAYGGTVGVPAIVPASAFAALRALTGDRGARGLLVGQSSIAWEPGAIDIDTPDDLAASDRSGRGS